MSTLFSRLRKGLWGRAGNAGGGTAGGMFAAGQATGEMPVPWREDALAQVRQYQQWVYVAVRAISARVSGTPLDFFQAGEPLPFTHPLRELFREINPFDTAVTLWMKTMTFLELTGNAYWYLATNSDDEGGGSPVREIWVIPSQYMRILPDANQYVGGYEYSCGSVRERFGTDEIVHLKYPSPESVYYGRGPLQAAADSVEAHAAMKRAERRSFEFGAFPGLAIQTDEKLSPGVRQRLEEAFERGFSGADRAGRTLILEQGLKVRPFTLSPREMDFLDSSRMTRDEILAVFGVPAAVAGISEDVNRASAEAMLYTFAENTILPKLRLIEAQLTQDVCRRFAPDIAARFASPVPAVRSEDRADMELRLRYGVTTPQEERARLQL